MEQIDEHKRPAQGASQAAVKVFDDADPGRIGKIINRGPEVSEVRFDDGATRNVVNGHLRTVDVETETKTPADGLSQRNPSPPVSEVVRLGQEAMARKCRGWDDWLLIAEALQAGRAEVMRTLNTNASGRRYERAMGDWLVTNGFKEIDKGTRSRLLDCLRDKAQFSMARSAD